jgi:hypothetical protein
MTLCDIYTLRDMLNLLFLEIYLAGKSVNLSILIIQN